LGVFEEFFAALLVAGAFVGEYGAGAGEVAQFADRLRGTAVSRSMIL
jgi:hypothetical protein